MVFSNIVLAAGLFLAAQGRKEGITVMKKGLTAFLTSLMIFSLVFTLCLGITGCGSKVSNVDISELQSREGLMFEVQSIINGPIDWSDDDRITGVTYSVYWDGSVTRTDHHAVSGNKVSGRTTVNSEDYLKIYKFAEDAYKNKTFRLYVETGVVDGSEYSFTYYPDGSKGTCLYGGYCYSNKALMDMVDLVTDYFTPVIVMYVNGAEVPVIWENTRIVDQLKYRIRNDFEDGMTVEIVKSGKDRMAGSLGQSINAGETTNIVVSTGDIVIQSHEELAVFTQNGSGYFDKLGRIDLTNDEIRNMFSGDGITVTLKIYEPYLVT